MPDIPGLTDTRCWNDPELDAALDAAAAAKEAGRPIAERVGIVLDHLRRVRTDPERHELATSNLTPWVQDDVDGIARALDAADGPDQVDLLAVLGVATVAKAWEIRGNGYASEVDADAWVPFHRMLEEADELLRIGLEMSPGQPTMAAHRLITARALSLPADEVAYRYEVAQQVCPTLVAAHSNMMENTKEKWGGSHEQMFAFARGLLDKTPPGDPLSMLLPLAHSQFRRSHPVDTDQDELATVHKVDVERLLAASQRLLATDPQARPHPLLPEAHQAFGFFFFYCWDEGLWEPARTHLRRGGRRAAYLPWAHEGDQLTEFRFVLQHLRVVPD